MIYKPCSLFALATALPCMALLSTALPSQNQLTAPSGYLNKPGESYSIALGGFDSGRYQAGEGTLRGKQFTITRVDYRTQTVVPYDQNNGIGRSWTQVSLKLSETNVDTMSTVWGANVIGTQTEVFKSSVKWPTLKGSIKPIWGIVSFPLSKPWVYNGQNDILFDYTFQGGTLENSQPIGRRPYYLDAVFTWDKPYRYVTSTILPDKFQQPLCNDSSYGTAPNAQTYLQLTMYSPAYPDQNKRGRVEVTANSVYTAPNAPILAALTLGGNMTGIDIAARCNKLHLDLNRLVAFLPALASNNTATGARTTLLPIGPYRYLSSYEGTELWMQAAWSDSQTKQFSLTLATSMTLPPKDFNLRKLAVFDTGISPSLIASTFGQTLPRLTVK